MTHKDLLFAIWLAMMIDVLAYLIFVNFLFRYLRRNHWAVWESLGSPSFFWNNSPRNGFLFVSWLLGRNYRLLNDKTAEKAGVATEILFWGAAVLFVLTLIVGITAHSGKA